MWDFFRLSTFALRAGNICLCFSFGAIWPLECTQVQVCFAYSPAVYGRLLGGIDVDVGDGFAVFGLFIFSVFHLKMNAEKFR